MKRRRARTNVAKPTDEASKSNVSHQASVEQQHALTTATDHQREAIAAAMRVSCGQTKENQTRIALIGDEILSSSATLKRRNFDRIGVDDLNRMVSIYDSIFFGGLLLESAKRDRFSVRFSSRMTSAGGKTTRTVYPSRRAAFGKKEPGAIHYEITISSSLLFQTFRDSQSTTKVCGIECADRLLAMQRIVEHELVHLAEMIVWEDSSCSKRRFQSIASGMFGHTEHRHELTTQRERAVKEFDIRLGDQVQFRIDNATKVGTVNRITRRATVLVEDSRGERYSNGKKYAKYYVPLELLKKTD